MHLGIEPIQYTPWDGKRTPIFNRIVLIADKVFKKNIKAKGVLALLIIGSILVHVFPILTTAIIPFEKLTAEMMVKSAEMAMDVPYMMNPFFALFSILLAAVVTSDLISSDLQDNSFILYFSRPIKPAIYLTSKLLGSASVLAVYCLMMPLIFCLVVIATQTGSDYLSSLKVMGMTFVAGLFITFFFSTMGLMMSSVTKRKAYAGVGTFMAFFAPMIISEFFAHFNENWKLLSPVNILHYTFLRIYGYSIPGSIEVNYYYAALFGYLILPLLFTYYILQRRAMGK